MLVLLIGGAALLAGGLWFIRNKGNQKKAASEFIEEDGCDVDESDEKD